MGLQITPKHVGAVSLSAGSIFGLVLTAIHWADSHLTATGTSICANGLSTGVVATVATGLGLLASAGVALALFLPSVSDRVNEKAGFAAGKRLSTVPPPKPPSNPPPPTEIQ